MVTVIGDKKMSSRFGFQEVMKMMNLFQIFNETMKTPQSNGNAAILICIRKLVNTSIH
jgi:hypothetical protein